VSAQPSEAIMAQSAAIDYHGGRPAALAQLSPRATWIFVASMAFATLVDLFAAQAILPLLAVRYDASPAAMGSSRSMPAPSAWRSPPWRWR
jgi:hypothetical protein